ncbi:hypothetical protein D3C74_110140 [compost metagenome]
MDKVVMRAFEKLQKREHHLRMARERMALGHTTRVMFRKEEAAIIETFKLTDEEQRAYETHIKKNRMSN